MSVNEIYDLLKKYRENECTPEEKERIIRWYQQFEQEAELLPEIPQRKLDQLWSSIENRVNGRKALLTTIKERRKMEWNWFNRRYFRQRELSFCN